MKNCRLISSLGLVAALIVVGCGGGEESDSNSNVGGTSAAGVGGATGSGTNTSVNSGGGAASASGNTGSSTSTSATGGASSPTTTTVNTGANDTSISEGEFSFFVISPAVIKANSPNISCDNAGTRCTNSLGGNFGGLDGADALCTTAAQAANPGDQHLWRAFLSTSTVNAIDRIGTGPWYSAPPKYQNKSNYTNDGLLFGSTKTEIATTDRPGDSETIVWNGVSPAGGGGGWGGGSAYDWPFNTCYLDETGICTTVFGDSHDTNAGSTTSGTFAGAGFACNDWTSASNSVKSKNGHSWCRTANCDGMNWIASSNEAHPCLGVINMTTSNESTGIGSGGGYGGFYCFAYSES